MGTTFLSLDAECSAHTTLRQETLTSAQRLQQHVVLRCMNPRQRKPGDKQCCAYAHGPQGRAPPEKGPKPGRRPEGRTQALTLAALLSQISVPRLPLGTGPRPAQAQAVLLLLQTEEELRGVDFGL